MNRTQEIYEQSKTVLLPKGENSKFLPQVFEALGIDSPYADWRYLHLASRR